jgi:cell volume regulation protein A
VAQEPAATALLLLTIGALLVAAVLLAPASERLRLPVALVFMGVGMLAGSEGIGRIPFVDYHLAFRVGTVALVLILFDGGFNTPAVSLARHFKPAVLLATFGVVLTAALVALAALALGWPWESAALLGAVVSSTDAASVFATLRGSGVSLKRRVGMTLELESGLNDPAAVILVTILTRLFSGSQSVLPWRIPLEIAFQLALGAAAGILVGWSGRAVLRRVRLSVAGLYPVLTLGLALVAFAAPSVVGGSGFLGVYLAGLLLGREELPYRASLSRVHHALAWLAQTAIFLMLGLLVFPSRLLAVAASASALAIVLALGARPLATLPCLAPFGYTMREAGFIAWAGLRGAVPVVLATIPVMARVEGAERLFDVVFFMVLLNALLPGATIPWLARRLGLESDEPPPPPALLEIESGVPLGERLLAFHIDEALAVAGSSLADLPLPEGAAVVLVVRGSQLVPATPETRLKAGDHVYVIAGAGDEPLIRLMFGRPAE